jgi:hypothetical protein
MNQAADDFTKVSDKHRTTEFRRSALLACIEEDLDELFATSIALAG